MVGDPPYLRLVEALQKDIDDRALAPGAFLPTQRELARRFGVSFSTVRAALVELAQRGAIVVVAASRPWVAGDPSASLPAEPVVRAVEGRLEVDRAAASWDDRPLAIADAGDVRVLRAIALAGDRPIRHSQLARRAGVAADSLAARVKRLNAVLAPLEIASRGHERWLRFRKPMPRAVAETGESALVVIPRMTRVAAWRGAPLTFRRGASWHVLWVLVRRFRQPVSRNMLAEVCDVSRLDDYLADCDATLAEQCEGAFRIDRLGADRFALMAAESPRATLERLRRVIDNALARPTFSSPTFTIYGRDAVVRVPVEAARPGKVARAAAALELLGEDEAERLRGCVVGVLGEFQPPESWRANGVITVDVLDPEPRMVAAVMNLTGLSVRDTEWVIDVLVALLDPALRWTVAIPRRAHGVAMGRLRGLALVARSLESVVLAGKLGVVQAAGGRLSLDPDVEEARLDDRRLSLDAHDRRVLWAIAQDDDRGVPERIVAERAGVDAGQVAGHVKRLNRVLAPLAIVPKGKRGYVIADQTHLRSAAHAVARLRRAVAWPAAPAAQAAPVEVHVAVRDGERIVEAVRGGGQAAAAAALELICDAEASRHCGRVVGVLGAFSAPPAWSAAGVVVVDLLEPGRRSPVAAVVNLVTSRPLAFNGAIDTLAAALGPVRRLTVAVAAEQREAASARLQAEGWSVDVVARTVRGRRVVILRCARKK